MFVQFHLVCDLRVGSHLRLLDSDMHRLRSETLWLNRQSFLNLVQLCTSQWALELWDAGWLGFTDNLRDTSLLVAINIFERATLIWALRTASDNNFGVDHSTTIDLGMLRLVIA